jgi:hypothetical protein
MAQRISNVQVGAATWDPKNPNVESLAGALARARSLKRANEIARKLAHYGITVNVAWKEPMHTVPQVEKQLWERVKETGGRLIPVRENEFGEAKVHQNLIVWEEMGKWQRTFKNDRDQLRKPAAKALKFAKPPGTATNTMKVLGVRQGKWLRQNVPTVEYRAAKWRLNQWLSANMGAIAKLRDQSISRAYKTLAAWSQELCEPQEKPWWDAYEKQVTTVMGSQELPIINIAPAEDVEAKGIVSIPPPKKSVKKTKGKQKKETSSQKPEEHKPAVQKPDVAVPEPAKPPALQGAWANKFKPLEEKETDKKEPEQKSDDDTTSAGSRGSEGTSSSATVGKNHAKNRRRKERRKAAKTTSRSDTASTASSKVATKAGAKVQWKRASEWVSNVAKVGAVDSSKPVVADITKVHDEIKRKGQNTVYPSISHELKRVKPQDKTHKRRNVPLQKAAGPSAKGGRASPPPPARKVRGDGDEPQEVCVSWRPDWWNGNKPHLLGDFECWKEFSDLGHDIQEQLWISAYAIWNRFICLPHVNRSRFPQLEALIKEVTQPVKLDQLERTRVQVTMMQIMKEFMTEKYLSNDTRFKDSYRIFAELAVNSVDGKIPGRVTDRRRRWRGVFRRILGRDRQIPENVLRR